MSSEEVFVDLNQDKKKDKHDFIGLTQERFETYNDNDSGQYEMLKRISFLFYYTCDLVLNKDKTLFELWPEKETEIKKRIDVINNCLDVYDIIFPYTERKPLFYKDDLENIHKFMDRLLYDVRYPIMDETGVDLNLEIGFPG